MISALTSLQNPLLKDIRHAASRGELTSAGCMIAEGIHLLEEALASPVEIAAVVVSESAQPATERLVARINDVRVVTVPDELFPKIASTEHPQGVIALVRPRTWTPQDLLRGTPLIVLLDAIQDPGNAGTIVRAAEAFGATGMVFLKGTVSPHNPKCLRASAGSLFRMPVIHDFSPASMPPMTLFAAMPRAECTLAEADLTKPCAIAVGSEGRGIGPDVASLATHVRIPTAGVESLNAALAAGIMLYEAHRQRTGA